MSTNEDQKQKVARKFLGLALSIIGIIILVLAIILIPAKGAFSLKKTEVEKTAVEALQMKLNNPVSLKVLEISAPDSVFVNRMCPEFEAIELSEKFLEFSLNIMKDSQQGLNNTESKAYRCKMDRYTESSSSLNILNNMMEKPQGNHCGWRVKVRYQAIDDSNTPYVSEAWFIFDKDRKHILNSLDISLL